ncbi:MAG: hypothetical protein KAG28_10535 [Cocleimonas sp.]|nr:hypothetical protein [Cocleimonas sp.]
MNSVYKEKDHSAAIAEAFFMAGLLFVGIFYIALWVLYLKYYDNASDITKRHLKQTLIASSISTAIFIIINIVIILGDGYISLTGLIGLEIYYMLIVPAFLMVGILGFSKAVNHDDFSFPLINNAFFKL